MLTVVSNVPVPSLLNVPRCLPQLSETERVRKQVSIKTWKGSLQVRKGNKLPFIIARVGVARAQVVLLGAEDTVVSCAESIVWVWIVHPPLVLIRRLLHHIELKVVATISSFVPEVATILYPPRD